jgi:hypothetical protein
MAREDSQLSDATGGGRQKLGNLCRFASRAIDHVIVVRSVGVPDAAPHVASLL